MKLLRGIVAGLALACSVSAFAQTNQGTSPLTGPKGGTNNAFMQFAGPATSLKTYTLPNANDTIATLGAIQTFTAAKTFSTLNATSLALGGASIGSNSLAVTGTTLLGNTAIQTASTSGFSVGLNNSTNPAFNVDASTALQAAGLNIKGAATGGTVAVSAIDSGAATNLTIDAKGTGTIGFGTVSTGSITLARPTTFSGAITYGGVALNNAVTGTGNMVLSTAPSIGGAAITTSTFNGNNFTTGTGTLTIAAGKTATHNASTTFAGVDGKTLTVNNSLTMAGTDGTTQTFPSTSATVARTDAAQTFTGNQTFSGSVLSTSPSAGEGYTTGAGGAVTQLTNRATAVTINTITGAITLVTATAVVGTWISFTVNDSSVGVNDVPQIAMKSNNNTYVANVSAISAGAFQISFMSIVGTASDTPVINFTITKGSIN